VSVISSWINLHKVKILNVAGSIASKDPDIYQDVNFIIEGVILFENAIGLWHGDAEFL